MSDVGHQVAELLEVRTTPGDTERALVRFKDCRRRRRRRRMVVAAAALSVMAAVIAARMLLPVAHPAPDVIAAHVEPAAEPAIAPVEEPETMRVVYFPDGSHAYLIKPRTQLTMEALSDDLLELTMASGEARFDVQPNPRRLFRVRTEDLRIEVLGTSFTVTAEEGSTRVLVHRGRVAVYQGQNRHELASGMSFSFDGERAIVEGQPEETPVKQKRSRRHRVRRSVDKSWKKLAKEGDLPAAYQAMSSGRTKIVEDATDDLMLAADVARLTGHPREAAQYLDQVVARHQSHPRAVLAAFTLGRILQHELDDPGRAAAAFHSAYALAPSGSLGEDALAHEIECWAQAGVADRAKARAEEYLQRYPDGRKQKQVRRMGGL